MHNTSHQLSRENRALRCGVKVGCRDAADRTFLKKPVFGYLENGEKPSCKPGFRIRILHVLKTDYPVFYDLYSIPSWVFGHVQITDKCGNHTSGTAFQNLKPWGEVQLKGSQG